MTIAKFSRRASAALLAFTIAACSDSTAPRIELTEAQVEDMLEAMALVSVAAPTPTMAVVTVSETVECPNGGTYSMNGSANDNGGSTTLTLQVSQGFNGCKSTSETSGRLWTFSGAINTNFTMTSNEETGFFSLNGTQAGTISASSDLGSGSCEINLTISISGGDDSFQASLTGTACGHQISQQISASG